MNAATAPQKAVFLLADAIFALVYDELSGTPRLSRNVLNKRDVSGAIGKGHQPARAALGRVHVPTLPAAPAEGDA